MADLSPHNETNEDLVAKVQAGFVYASDDAESALSVLAERLQTAEQAAGGEAQLADEFKAAWKDAEARLASAEAALRLIDAAATEDLARRLNDTEAALRDVRSWIAQEEEVGVFVPTLVYGIIDAALEGTDRE